jgi:hypothetical protein
MKRIFSLAIVMILAIGAGIAKDNKGAANLATVKADNYSISYGQPSKNGRVIFGDKQSHAVAPAGEVWRPGTETAPVEITINKDCLFAGHQLKAGKYTLLIKPMNMEWLIILNNQLGQKGVFNYEKVKSKDALVAAIAAKTGDNTVEAFTITGNNDGFSIAWDHTSGFISMKTFGGQ